MSVVARQSFKYSIIGYFGFLLGTVSAFFVFPYDMEFYGKLRYILSAAEVVLPFIVFGLSYANVKFFLQAQKENKHQNLLSLSLLMILMNFILFLVILFLANFINQDLKNWGIFKDFWNYKSVIIPLVLILAISQVYNRYISNYKRIVIPNIFENVFPKIANLGAFILFFFMGLPEKPSLLFFILVLGIALLGYHLYLNKLEPLRPDFSFAYIKKGHFWKEVLNYGFYGFLGNIGNYLSFRIAGVMIPGYLDFKDNGVYGIIIAITSILTVPQMGLYNIAAPIVNKQLENKDMQALNSFYRKTSLSLLFLGLVLFSCVLVGYNYLTDLMKNGSALKDATPVLWITGIGLMFELATGFNGQIISMSRYYRYNIVVTLFLAILNVGLNFYFLKYTNLGLSGVALATTLSLVLYNMVKVLFNYRKFGVQPFSWAMFFALLLCGFAICLVNLLPDSAYSLLNLFYKPLGVLLIVGIGNYYIKILPTNSYLNKDFLRSIFKFK
ncbi:polysaccharide biosynthesis protein [Elizabethkingia argentiflava]|uniref:Polysaccharide biosynthesis protein n=1 Tax=Elizabethkingia argenteiflava TaxID=2681556 RepID=A0A845PW22_9FLAO|nr:polysaccharide biosynthesis C-terminal domain-containing protein [Elizabethkingia argenteiflava]NAW51066.1 polysaccharide biosynthesis protein [Elizabethkingia argenteiflava]